MYIRVQFWMFHSGVSAVHHSLGLAALDTDGLWDDQFDSLSRSQYDVVSLNSRKEVLHYLWHNWSFTDLSVFDVQNGLLQPHLRQRPRCLNLI